MLAGGASRGEGGLVSLVTFGGGGGYSGGLQQTKMMNQRIKEKVKPANISPPSYIYHVTVAGIQLVRVSLSNTGRSTMWF